MAVHKTKKLYFAPLETETSTEKKMASLDQLVDPEPHSPTRLVARSSSQPEDCRLAFKQERAEIAQQSSDSEGLRGDGKESTKASAKNRRHNRRGGKEKKLVARRQQRDGDANEDMFSMFSWSTDEASDDSEVEMMRHEHALCRESSFKQKISKEVCKPQRRPSQEDDDLFEMFQWSKNQTAPPAMIHQQRKKHEEYLRSLSKDQLEPVCMNGWFRGNVLDFAFDTKAEGNTPPCFTDAGSDDDDEDEPLSRSLVELGRRSRLAQERSKSLNPVLNVDNDPSKRASMDAIKQNYSAPKLMAYLDEDRVQNKNVRSLSKQFSSGGIRSIFNVLKLRDHLQTRNKDESI